MSLDTRYIRGIRWRARLDYMSEVIDIEQGLVRKRQAGNGRAALMTTQLEERDGAA